MAGHQREKDQSTEARSGNYRLTRGVTLGFLFRFGIDVELGTCPRRPYSEERAKPWRQRSHDVQCGLVAVSVLCRSHSRNHLLHLPDAKKRNNVPTLGGSRWYYWVTPALMGLFWFGSIMCYSLASVKLGVGTSHRVAFVLSAVVIASTIAGVITGEWRNSGRKALTWMWVGVGCLVAAMGLLASTSV